MASCFPVCGMRHGADSLGFHRGFQHCCCFCCCCCCCCLCYDLSSFLEASVSFGFRHCCCCCFLPLRLGQQSAALRWRWKVLIIRKPDGQMGALRLRQLKTFSQLSSTHTHTRPLTHTWVFFWLLPWQSQKCNTKAIESFGQPLEYVSSFLSYCSRSIANAQK